MSGTEVGDGPDEGGADRRLADPTSVEWLARAAIRRLATETGQRAGGAAHRPSDGAIDAFCRLLVSGDYAAAETMLRRLTARRTDYAQIADGFLCEAARRLGRGWEEDSLSFADVTVAISQIFRLNQAFRQRHVPLRRGREQLALFATLPGQQHNLGLVLAAEAFRREGWQVDLRLDCPSREIVEITQRTRPVLIGLTTSHFDRRHHIANLIGNLRALPLSFRVMLGGRGAQALAVTLPRGRVDRVVTDIGSALKEA
jgi:methanogenic corrinoid protein MtbC1